MEEIVAAAVILSGIALGNVWIVIAGFILFLILFAIGYVARHSFRGRTPHLARARENPVLGPLPEHAWENQAVFNPAAVYVGDRVHLLYRALGEDGISRVGYASSADGVHFDERLPHPVFIADIEHLLSKFRNPFTSPARSELRYNPALYASGGGWGGSEDPRAVEIEGVVYMTYSAFNGWESLRMMLTSLHADALLAKTWRWNKPVPLSPPGSIHKNWVLFPEKIHGKYAILHSVAPEVEVEYVDDLSRFERGEYIESHYDRTKGRPHHWDKWVRGTGAPPLKTSRGWLLFYHGMDPAHVHIGYNIGAMLLDLEEPTKILFRSSKPILTPDMPYENDWKPGVVYGSGAVIKDGTLFLYYGGGDKTVNVATAPLENFLRSLMHDEHAVLAPAV
ncbi:MAG: hypothetical protein KGJ34_00275 [Patescibacteria group bacterium]|nr:hypothetical protein [Patescibacteria group bacterium]